MSAWVPGFDADTTIKSGTLIVLLSDAWEADTKDAVIPILKVPTGGSGKAQSRYLVAVDLGLTKSTGYGACQRWLALYCQLL